MVHDLQWGRGPVDKLLYTRAGSTDLEATENGTALHIYGTPVHGMALVVNVPAIVAGADTLDVTVEVSPDNSNWYEVAAIPQITGVTSAPKEYYAHFSTDEPYVRAVFTVAGSAPNFGKVKAWLTEYAR